MMSAYKSKNVNGVYCLDIEKYLPLKSIFYIPKNERTLLLSMLKTCIIAPEMLGNSPDSSASFFDIATPALSTMISFLSCYIMKKDMDPKKSMKAWICMQTTSCMSYI